MDVRPPSNLDDLGIRHIYELYGALAGIMSPAEANETELWELAAVLKVDPGVAEYAGLDERLQKEATPEQLAARVAKAHIKPRRSSKEPATQDIPEVEATPPPDGADMTVQVMRQMGIRTN